MLESSSKKLSPTMLASDQQSVKLIAIAAMDRRHTIGYKGKLPWHLPEDLKFFRRTTMGHTVVMGRKTFESLGKPLPGRKNVVLSKTVKSIPGAIVIDSFEKLFELPDLGQSIFLIGGAIVFNSLLPRCDELVLTEVEGDWLGDTFLRDVDKIFGWKKTLLKGEGFVVSHLRILPTAKRSAQDFDADELALGKLATV